MNKTKLNPPGVIPFWSGLAVLLFLALNLQISAQIKFTVLLSDGTYKQYPVEGLKLTFSNDGFFSVWDNNISYIMNFAGIDKISFSNLISGIRDNDIKPSVSVHIDRWSGFLNIIGGSYELTEIRIYSIHSMVMFNRRQSLSEPIDISRYPTGIYILKAGDQYLKFIKP